MVNKAKLLFYILSNNKRKTQIAINLSCRISRVSLLFLVFTISFQKKYWCCSVAAVSHLFSVSGLISSILSPKLFALPMDPQSFNDVSGHCIYVLFLLGVSKLEPIKTKKDFLETVFIIGNLVDR